ncbi:MAG: 6-phosphofructokinase, partial [Anaerolineae bacterium]|nr:6-phosphofructokinase [Anaerolineae bacterium]
GVLSSGGDGPGFNPCIRAVVRMGISYGMTVMGIHNGYSGLINGEIEEMTARSVGGIIGRGGTILGTARSEEFKTERGRRTAMRRLNERGVEGLIVIGGDGSFRGALKLHQEFGFPVVGVPGTIDNDISGTDMCIGVDTALNTVLDAIDKIRDTASSHQRAFLIEVMGRACGYLALMSGLAGGAEMVLLPEVETSPEEVAAALRNAYLRGKAHCIIAVAEGYKPGMAAVANYLEERESDLGFEVRTTVLGHVQRGGSPTAFERLLATRLGVAAVDAIRDGQGGVMIGLIGNKITLTPLEQVVSQPRCLDLSMHQISQALEK